MDFFTVNKHSCGSLEGSGSAVIIVLSRERGDTKHWRGLGETAKTVLGMERIPWGAAAPSREETTEPRALRDKMMARYRSGLGLQPGMVSPGVPAGNTARAHPQLSLLVPVLCHPQKSCAGPCPLVPALCANTLWGCVGGNNSSGSCHCRCPAHC